MPHADPDPGPAPGPDAAARLFQLATQHWVPQALYVCARLEVADRLAEGPRTAADLARSTGTHPENLERLLRALSAVGVFEETTRGAFRQTALSSLLRSGAAPSLRPAVLYLARESVWSAWSRLLDAVRTGRPAFDLAHGLPAFDYGAAHPEHADDFNRFMAAAASGRHQAVAKGCDFGRFGTVVDVGGGHGAMLIEILRRNPRLRGVVFDLPHAVAGAAPAAAAAGVADRCEPVPGSFFESVPAGGDAYLLSQILHDWDDESSLLILRNCRRAMPAGATLFLVELVMPPIGADPMGAFMDINMMTMLTGKERTERAFSELLTRSGFRLDRTIPIEAPQRLIEATAA